MAEQTTVNVKGVDVGAWERARRLARADGASMGEWLTRAVNYFADAAEAGPRELPPIAAAPAPIGAVQLDQAAPLLAALAAVAASGGMSRTARARMNALAIAAAAAVDGGPPPARRAPPVRLLAAPAEAA